MNVFLSFDDGRLDNYLTALPILIENKLTATFHICTGFVDGSYESDVFGVGRKPVSIQMIKEISDLGFEISSHGDRHILEKNDYLLSVDKITKWTNGQKRVGLSLPNSIYNNAQMESIIQCDRPPLYIRGGRSKDCYSFKRKIAYVLYHIFHLQTMFSYFNKINIFCCEDNVKVLPSLVVKKDTRAKHLIELIEQNKENNGNLIIMFHSIVKNTKTEWEWPEEEFAKLCKYLGNNCEVNVLTLSSVFC